MKRRSLWDKCWDLLEETPTTIRQRQQLEMPYSLFRASMIAFSIEDRGLAMCILLPLIMFNCVTDTIEQKKIPRWVLLTIGPLLAYYLGRLL